jgi:hypothetical protein
MVETAQVASLRDDGQLIDRSDTWNLPQEQIILAMSRQLVGLCFYHVALTDQASCFGNDHAEYTNSRRLRRQWQSDRGARRLVDIHQNLCLADFATKDVPCSFNKRVPNTVMVAGLGGAKVPATGPGASQKPARHLASYVQLGSPPWRPKLKNTNPLTTCLHASKRRLRIEHNHSGWIRARFCGHSHPLSWP